MAYEKISLRGTVIIIIAPSIPVFEPAPGVSPELLGFSKSNIAPGRSKITTHTGKILARQKFSKAIRIQRGSI
jgi:hypothetical protein